MEWLLDWKVEIVTRHKSPVLTMGKAVKYIFLVFSNNQRYKKIRWTISSAQFWILFNHLIYQSIQYDSDTFHRFSICWKVSDSVQETLVTAGIRDLSIWSNYNVCTTYVFMFKLFSLIKGYSVIRNSIIIVEATSKTCFRRYFYFCPFGAGCIHSPERCIFSLMKTTQL